MRRAILLIALLPFLFTTCASTGSGGDGLSSDKAPLSAGSAQPENPFYSGSGGSGSSIAILPPKGVGLENNLAYLPTVVQGELVNNFSGYSAIRVLDRVTLDDQFAELLSGYYPDDMEGVITLGHMPPTTYIMMGRITKTATGYALQITIAKTADGTTEASYSGTCTVAELDNFIGIRRASLELLEKIGVELSAASKTALSGAGTANQVNAQTALAQGITAQRSGTEVAALSYYYQAAAFDPSLLEAVNRASVMTANITSGNIGTDVRNDIQWRKDWIARLNETEQYFDNFFKTSSPTYGLFYLTTIARGKIDYTAETLPLSFRISFHAFRTWFDSTSRALQTVYNGLNATRRKNDWGLAGWPQKTVTSHNPFMARSKDFVVIFELVNNTGKVIGRQTVTLKGAWTFNFGTQITLNYQEDTYQTVNFGAVNANDITDTLTIHIASVNGADPQTLTQSGVLRIQTLSVREFDFCRDIPIELSARGEIQGFKKGKWAATLFIPDTIWGEPLFTSIRGQAFSGRELAVRIHPEKKVQRAM